MRIEIVNWNKYNPRSELKTIPWFRVQNCIVHDRKLYGLVPAQKWLWICLLSIAAQENNSVIELSCEYLEHYAGIEKNLILQAIEHFGKVGLLVQTCTGRGTKVYPHVTNDTNVTNETNKDTSYLSSETLLNKKTSPDETSTQSFQDRFIEKNDHYYEDQEIPDISEQENSQSSKIIQLRQTNLTPDALKREKGVNSHSEKLDASESKFEGLEETEDDKPSKRKKSSKRLNIEPDEGDQKIGKEWASWTHQIAPHIKPDQKRYAVAVAKVRMKMKMSHEDVAKVFQFVKDDKFWMDKCFSPVSLLTRSKTNDLLKIENIINSASKDQMKYAKVMDYARKRDAGLIRPLSEGFAF